MNSTESTVENRREMGSTARNRETEVKSKTLSAMRAEYVEAVLEAMAKEDAVQISATTHEQQSDSSLGALSLNDCVPFKFATSTDVDVDVEEDRMYPEEYMDKVYVTADGVKYFDNRTFGVRDDTFKYPFYVHLEKAVKNYVRSGRGLISQVSLVDPDVFLGYIPQVFMFNNAPQADSAILKVYDPIWYNNGRDDGLALQELCKNELVIYEKLLPLMGEVVPLIYSYGYMIDVSIMVGQLYKKFIGPYILMQPLERSKRFEKSDVDLEFVQTRIIPQFKRLHELEVVHNDFKWENILVTEDREVKIIDFSHSFISSNEKDYDEEIGKIYGYFGFSNPGSV